MLDIMKEKDADTDGLFFYETDPQATLIPAFVVANNGHTLIV